MKRKFFLFFVLIISSVKIFATEQVPDILIYENKKLYLQTGWGHPSPFETYFIQNNINSPFKMISTANYRGFVATWNVKNGNLYLTYVDDEKSKKNQLNKIFKNIEKDGVVASWFSGVIVADDFSHITSDEYDSLNEYYFYIKNGIVQNLEIVAYENLFDEEKTQNLSPSIKDMLSLNYRYISYYFRLWSYDSISYKGEKARLVRKRNTSPILSYYSEDNLLWPYNWENKELFGAPHCEWNVIGNQIYLTDISLHSGTRFDGPDIENLPLNKIFSDAKNDNEIFAKWLNGVFIIQYGHEVKHDYYDKFEVTENILINVKDGMIVEDYLLGKDFSFSKRKSKYSSKIENLLKEF